MSACKTRTVWLCHQVLGLVTSATWSISCVICGATVTHDCLGKSISADFAGRFLEFGPHSRLIHEILPLSSSCTSMKWSL
jgi:hypothetical protein